jgi:hypothetical protein
MFLMIKFLSNLWQIFCPVTTVYSMILLVRLYLDSYCLSAKMWTPLLEWLSTAEELVPIFKHQGFRAVKGICNYNFYAIANISANLAIYIL